MTLAAGTRLGPYEIVAAGPLPCAIVATTGTTTSTALDPGREHRGDRAGSRRLASRGRRDGGLGDDPSRVPLYVEGIEAADSLVLNAHKWLGAAFDCSPYYVRDPEHLVRVMSTNPSYLKSSVDSRVKNLRDWGIPLGRRFRALKLGCLIREQGVLGLQARLRRDLENARRLPEQVKSAAHWRVLAPVPLQTQDCSRASSTKEPSHRALTRKPQSSAPKTTEVRLLSRSNPLLILRGYPPPETVLQSV